VRTTARRAGEAVKKAAQKAGRLQSSPAPEPVQPSPEQKRAERRRRLLASNLTELAIEFRTDKWGVHKYTPHYERHLEHLRRESFTLLELGIGGYKKRRKSGASMKMWRWFFPRATIVGLDIEDTQTSYWPAWGGELDPKAPGTSMDLVKDLIDGLNHEEFLVEGYQPTYTDQWVRAVHCYHNLVIIEKGDNREGTNRDRVAHELYGASELPEG